MKQHLSISEALQLNKLLEYHIPDEISPNMLEFVGTIISSMIAKGEHANFVKAIMIMNGITDDEVVKMKQMEAINAFVEGFVRHDVWNLREFCKTLRNEANG
jgi:hypothetical protein